MLFATFVRGQRLSVFYAAFPEPPAAGTSAATTPAQPLLGTPTPWVRSVVSEKSLTDPVVSQSG
jgi:hypothetical protein